MTDLQAKPEGTRRVPIVAERHGSEVFGIKDTSARSSKWTLLCSVHGSRPFVHVGTLARNQLQSFDDIVEVEREGDTIVRVRSLTLAEARALLGSFSRETR